MQKQIKLFIHLQKLIVNDCTVDLAGENPGKYTIDIYIGENIFSGSFFIEEESNYQI